MKFAFFLKIIDNTRNRGKKLASQYAIYDTLIDDITMISDGVGLTGLLFGAVDPIDSLNEENVLLYDTICELNQYFFGQRKKFDIKLSLEFFFQHLPFG